jgi:hypothetical protein
MIFLMAFLKTSRLRLSHLSQLLYAGVVVLARIMGQITVTKLKQ